MRVLVFAMLGLFACGTSVGPGTGGPPPPPPPDAGGSLPASGPAQLLVNSGLVEAVPLDLSELAYLASPSNVVGTSTGTLAVASLLTGDSATVANNVWSAAFPITASSADTLVYLTDPTASIDANQDTVYGAVNLWQSGMTTGVRLSSGFAPIRATAIDGSSTLFWDTPTASNQGTGSVVLVRSVDCAETTCMPRQLATGVTVVAMALSTDGLHGAYAVKNAPGSFGVFLVTVATGAVSTIATTSTSGSISFSPDGSLLASIDAKSAPLVTAAATGQPMSWSAMPVGSKSTAVGFSDPATLLVRSLAGTPATATISKTTASAISPVTTGPTTLTMFVVRNTATATGTARYLFTSVAPANGIGDIEAYDLTAMTPVAIPLASSAALNSISVSFDQTYARVLEDYDPAARTGTLSLAAMPSGSLTTLPAGVALGSSAFGRVHSLFYVDPTNSDTLTELTDGAAAALSTNVAGFRLRAGNAYFSVDATDSLYNYAAGIYATPFP